MKLELIAPKTRASQIGYACLLLLLPLMSYKIVHKLTGQPNDYESQTVRVLAGLAMFGWVAGLLLLGIETIRSAVRDKR
jgi:hypothetical protein